VEDSITFD